MIDGIKIYGFIHVATIGDWRVLLDEQLDLIRSTGLEDVTDLISIGKVGQHAIDRPLICDVPDLREYEFPTLAKLQENASKPGYTWYVHLKGVSKTAGDFAQFRGVYRRLSEAEHLTDLQLNERAWRNYMNHFVVENFSACAEALVDHDIAGVHWRDRPFPHFSGNFWWARNDYLSRLVTPLQFREQISWYVDVFGLKRAHAEFWIGSGKPRVKVLFNSPHNLYSHRIHPSEYARSPLL